VAADRPLAAADGAVNAVAHFVRNWRSGTCDGKLPGGRTRFAFVRLGACQQRQCVPQHKEPDADQHERQHPVSIAAQRLAKQRVVHQQIGDPAPDGGHDQKDPGVARDLLDRRGEQRNVEAEIVRAVADRDRGNRKNLRTQAPACDVPFQLLARAFDVIVLACPAQDDQFAHAEQQRDETDQRHPFLFHVHRELRSRGADRNQSRCADDLTQHHPDPLQLLVCEEGSDYKQVVDMREGEHDDADPEGL